MDGRKKGCRRRRRKKVVVEEDEEARRRRKQRRGIRSGKSRNSVASLLKQRNGEKTDLLSLMSFRYFIAVSDLLSPITVCIRYVLRFSVDKRSNSRKRNSETKSKLSGNRAGGSFSTDSSKNRTAAKNKMREGENE